MRLRVLFGLVLVLAIAACRGQLGRGTANPPPPDASRVDDGGNRAPDAPVEGGVDSGLDGGAVPNPLAPGRIVVLGSSTAAPPLQ